MASSAWQFWANYFLLGLGWSMYEVGRFVLGLEICPVQRRASYLAVMMAILAPSLIISSQIGAAAKEHVGGFTVVAWIAAAIVGISIVLLLPIKEPRTHPVPEIPPPSRAVPR